MRERLLQFYTGGEIVLSADEENYKLRLDECYKLVRSWKYKRADIILQLQRKFDKLSKYRAEKDISDCYYIFGRAYTPDKAMIASLLVEDIMDTIQLTKAARKFDLLPKLYDSLTKATQQLPAESVVPVRAKKIIIYNIHGEKAFIPKVDPLEALKAARSQFPNVTDIESEEVK